MPSARLSKGRRSGDSGPPVADVGPNEHVLLATGSLASLFFYITGSARMRRGHSKSEINDRVHTILEVGGCKALQSPEVLGYTDTAEAQDGQKRSGMMRARSPN
jgi:hypothetical protein